MKGNSFILVAAFAATFSLSSNAATPLTLEQRVQQLEQQNQTQSQLQSTMSMQLIELQKEVKELRGIIEEHDYKLKQIQDRQRDLYRDIENRLSAIPQGTSPAIQSSTPAVTTQTKPPVTSLPTQQAAPAADERSEFEAAFTQVRNREYTQAIKSFESFLSKYPNGAYSDNARFWIGQVYFAQGKYDESEKEFKKLRSDYPNSSKLSAAILKLAEIKVQQKKWEEAKALYNEVVANHTGAQQQLARKGLQDIKQAGH
jgi:tol-pal system protein YbgF